MAAKIAMSAPIDASRNSTEQRSDFPGREEIFPDDRDRSKFLGYPAAVGVGSCRFESKRN